MKIVLTGGGGGHFYPMVAVAEAIREISEKEKILNLELIYISDSPYDQKSLDDAGVRFAELKTGKNRLYFSIENFFDIFKTFFAIIKAIFLLYRLLPDVVFSKGGYPAVPVVIAAKILNIPVVIHESDSYPGRANKMASKWAKRIAISYKEAAEYLPKEKTAFVGNIVRKDVREPLKVGAYEYLKLNAAVKTILIVGGSQGAKIINDTIINSLDGLLQNYQIIHQVGTKNFDEVKALTDVILKDNPNKERYHIYPYLNKLALRMSAGVTGLIVSRAGAGFLAEIASWGVPSIIVPINKSNGDHQRKNAYNYAATGGCVVIEESNLKPHVIVSEINRILGDENISKQMSEGSKLFVHPDAEDKIAEEIIKIALTHEN
ncbi:MAG: UDP-N-acetylglucosamine--N-acetylmuramyl-(pentapeptide) pyrophosphoryl-undecaprenol [Patescibacteria group bacterium]|jgi:UDP-N-acetylglucosamine--N-acetylmuramyl-(pentapeptide) pyrophosphoryl-undecaprenol N-acetylglucosamine transferase|nr:UDP-N-acetylglucosamine--N-acetylmuramyl-(pentapeptide) pyrophosphoryl-undecaprenol [Patescibacteria group bacterium]